MNNSDLFNSVIYSKSSDNKNRYALGTKGVNPLCCLGINPSTATPDKYDPTVTRVKNIAFKNGYDSHIMFNIYPLRSTDPRNLPQEIDYEEHTKNINVILELIKDGYTIWAAWGDLIESRDYLKKCGNDIMSAIGMSKKNIRWVKMGELTKKGNPRHPLYVYQESFSEWCFKI